LRRIGTIVVLVAPWFLLVWHLSSFWLVDPEYSYGWAVPALAAFVAWKKWQTFAPEDGKNAMVLSVAILLALLLGPIWCVHYAVPDWSGVNWLFALTVVGYLLALLTYLWGVAAARHFLFPVLFILVAVPWPQRFELVLVQGLMKEVAANAATKGFAAFGEWHDPAGFGILCVSFCILGIISFAFRRQPLDSQKLDRQMSWPSWTLIGGVAVWIALFLLATEIWYRRNEKLDSRFLTVTWPSDALHLTELSISDTARRLLLYDSARCASWRDSSGLDWSVYFLVWNSGRTSTQSARIHRPENCFQGSGAILLADLKPVRVDVGGAGLSFRSYLFAKDGVPLYVYYLVWEEANLDVDPAIANQDFSGFSRLQRVWLAQRNLGQQSIEIVLSGVRDEDQAIQAIRANLGRMVRVGSRGEGPVHHEETERANFSGY
jgi:hypothetical protein